MSQERKKNGAAVRVVHPIAPVYAPDSGILILGSFPSVKSREGMFFYHHPQNRFWRLLALLTEEETPRTVEEKKTLVLRHGFALWDVIGECEIAGSSDVSIRHVIPNDIGALLRQTQVKRILANGDKAYRLYEKYCFPQTGLHAVRCPSTSPANAAFSLERLAEAWRAALKEPEPAPRRDDKMVMQGRPEETEKTKEE